MVIARNNAVVSKNIVFFLAWLANILHPWQISGRFWQISGKSGRFLSIVHEEDVENLGEVVFLTTTSACLLCITKTMYLLWKGEGGKGGSNDSPSGSVPKVVATY